MRLRAVILSALSIVSLGLIVLVAPTGPAWACSCVSRERAEASAELIVVGTVTEVTDTHIRLAVESVEKGSLGAATTLRLQSGRNGASCGYDFRVAGRYRVNSVKGATGLCRGVRPLPARPAASSVAPTIVAVAPVPSPVSVPAQGPGRGWLVSGALLVAFAVGLVAVVGWRRRGPRPPSGFSRSGSLDQTN